MSGISVKLMHLSTGPLLARVAAEQDSPQWSVVWFDGDEAMWALAHQGQLRCHTRTVAAWNTLGKALVPRNGCYVPTGVTIADAMVVNTDDLSAGAPLASWADLVLPQYRGVVGMNDPAISGPTYPLVAGRFKSLGGMAAGKHYFLALKRNGLKVYPTNSATLRALEFGQTKVALVQNSAGIGFVRMGFPFAVLYRNPVTLLPSDIAISSTTHGPVLDEARRFIAFVLSKAGQAAMRAGDPRGDSNYYAVVHGAPPDPYLPPLNRIPWQRVSPAVWGAREPVIVSWFTNHIVH